MPSMSSQRPYLLRAIHQWILDNGCTPYLVIDADAPGVQVPRQYVNEGRIVLNVAPGAVNALIIGNSEIDFDCRFGGVSTHLTLPLHAVRGIYAKENGQGLIFDPNDEEPPPGGPDRTAGKSSPRHLSVVK
jgi:stringent starvation protein B